jgi:hypothetical protein
MEATDRRTFDQAFTNMTRAFRLRLKPTELEELTTTYFKILGAAPLEDVLAAGKTVLEQSRTFPKAAEWFQALPAGARELTTDCRVMPADELADYHRAERQHYEDEPCSCLGCQLAGVTARPLRFVPDFTDQDRAELAYDNVRRRIVHTGHWAHGDELARWYTARAAFFASVPRHSPMARALLVLVPGEREPGEEG